MIAETGQICLIIAIVLSLLQAFGGFIGAHRRDSALMVLSDRGALAQAIFCIAAFVCLATLFITSNFSVRLVAQHSHTLKPLLYKFSGTWGQHEGSMLLWVTLLAVFGALVVVFGRDLPATLRARALAVQGLIATGFGSFLLFTSNPFTRLTPIPKDGLGLNPVLQDPGLAFHPPFLYLGYVGFSIAFSFAVAALLERRVDAIWARWIRPWVLLAWSFLTVGIVLGSYWAYYELGWGGWWSWDPVENVSFMPWLAGTALLHSTLVVQSRSSFVRWTLLLAIVTFSLSLVGAFIVRSGTLTSVHAFAVDPARGVYLLALLLVATGGALLLYYLRSEDIEHGANFEPVSREGGFVLNNLLLSSAIATVFLGTFYPLVMEVVAQKISVGPPYYEMVFAPIMSVLIVFMGVAPMLKWGNDSLSNYSRILAIMGFIALAILIIGYIWGRSFFGALGLALAAWLWVGTLGSYARKLRIGRPNSSIGNLWSRAKLQPAATYGFALAHLGLAICVVGISAMSGWSTEANARVKIGSSLSVGQYEFVLADARDVTGPNYVSTQLDIRVLDQSKIQISDLVVESRYYPVEGTHTSEGSMDTSPWRTLYTALGEGDAERGWVLHGYIHPFVSWIWGGALLMALGGFVSLADRRIGFAKKKRTHTNTVSAIAE